MVLDSSKLRPVAFNFVDIHSCTVSCAACRIVGKYRAMVQYFKSEKGIWTVRPVGNYGQPVVGKTRTSFLFQGPFVFLWRSAGHSFSSMEVWAGSDAQIGTPRIGCGCALPYEKNRATDFDRLFFRWVFANVLSTSHGERFILKLFSIFILLYTN